jgi:hypothetical protein
MGALKYGGLSCYDLPGGICLPKAAKSFLPVSQRPNPRELKEGYLNLIAEVTK